MNRSLENQFQLFRALLIHSGKTGMKNMRRFRMKTGLYLSGADQEARIRAERRWRGREEFTRLKNSDAVIVSFGKSGRTWLRVMISRLYQQVYGLPEHILIGFDNLHNMEPRIPRLLFTHDTYIGDYTGNTDSKADFHDKKVLMLVRDPRDVMVSKFFHMRFRARASKKLLNPCPPHERDEDLFDAVCHQEGGLPRIIRFMNLWAREMPNIRTMSLLRYEDLRADPHAAMTRVAQFLDIPATEAQIRDAVEFAAFENMKKKESEQAFRLFGGRMALRDQNNPDSYKVRRAKVGGYRDYFDDEQIRHIDEMVNTTLDPLFGYNAADPMADGHPTQSIRAARPD